MRRLTLWSLMVVACLVESPTEAKAQLGQVGVSRPSAFGPSAALGVIGRVGGRYSGRFDSDFRTSSGAGSLGISGQAVDFAPRRGFEFRGGGTGFRRGQFSRDVLPTVGDPSRFATNLGRASFDSWRNSTRYIPSALMVQSMTGVGSAMSMERDLTQPIQAYTYPHIEIAAPSAPPASPYHDFFGLLVAKPEPPPATEFEKKYVQPGQSLADQVLAKGEQRQRMNMGSALIEFKDATTGPLEGRMPKLILAMRRMENVCKALPNEFLPRLLLAHLAFERGQAVFGMSCLAEAVARRPTLFVDDYDVGQWFGERDVFEKQLRRYVQSSRTGKASPETLVVEGYCAFLLGDKKRAMAAVNLADKQSLERSFVIPASRDTLESLIYALRAAAQE